MAHTNSIKSLDLQHTSSTRIQSAKKKTGEGERIKDSSQEHENILIKSLKLLSYCSDIRRVRMVQQAMHLFNGELHEKEFVKKAECG